jgi:DNA processing protein
MAAAAKHGAQFVGIGEPDYPPLLKRMDHPPPLLAVKGTPSVFSLSPVAIVGARNASLAGIKIARNLAAELGAHGYAVISGLARGIDRAAHEGALSTGTVAVLAGGLDRPYPPENIELGDEIAATGGAVISEMPFGWEPRARDFPRRNRIVAGLSLGLVVVEAAKRSGSLISARLAGEMGRLVFAVPGSPLDPRAEGGNHLIREGATLCAEASHVIEALEPLLRGHGGFAAPPGGRRDGHDATRQEALWDELDLPGIAAAPVAEPIPEPAMAMTDGQVDIRAHLLALLGTAPVALDDLVRASGESARNVSRIMMELELEGAALRQSGGLFCRSGS